MTTEHRSFIIKQISIFLENKQGRLADVAQVIADANINFSISSIAESVDFGILRGIVSDPEKACRILKEQHFAVTMSEVVGIRCSNTPGSLAKILRYLSDADVSIEYMYSYIHNNVSDIIIRPDDMERCLSALSEKEVELVEAEEVYHY